MDSVSRIPSSGGITPGSYCRCIAEVDSHEVDDLVYFVRQEGDVAHYIDENSRDTMDAELFYECFEAAPEGKTKRSQQIAALIDELDEMDLHGAQVALQLSDSASGMTSGLLTLGDEDVPASGDTTLATTQQTPHLVLKQRLAEAKQLARATAQTLESKQRKLKALLGEKALIAQSRLEALEKVAENIGNVISCINLYLGRDEQVYTLRSGDAAPADVPITIRQQVLFMDEECAVAAEHGGIDFRDLDEFDAWLLADPSHLNQVLPEQKGVVALKPRYHLKEYPGDAWSQAVFNHENRRTYFLIRNGENLYRVCNELQIGPRLFPAEDEFKQFFFERDRATGEEKPMRPGSKPYMDAMEEAEAVRHHYLKVALMLQGLIDRTKVFHPMPEGKEKVNMLNPAEYGQTVQFLRDDENLLDDGRIRFTDWLAEAMSRLEVGQRVAWRGDLPHEQGDELKLYTVEGTHLRPKLFVEQTWRSRSMRRKSHDIDRTGTDVIPYDLVTSEQIDYYMHSRANRRDYAQMFPLLQAVRRLKRVEEKAEAPFRELLLSMMAQESGRPKTEIAPQVDDLVRWWKFKTLSHRALLSDDQKAYEMIMAEFRLRLRREGERDTSKHDAIVQQILATEPDTLYIGHKTGKTYVSLTAANKGNVFVHEILWKSGKTIAESERKEWTVPDGRILKWHQIYTSERWTDWKRHVHRRDYLSDPEIAWLCEEILRQGEAFEQRGASNWEAEYHPNFTERHRWLPLVIALGTEYEERGRFTLFESNLGPLLIDPFRYDTLSVNPSCRELVFKWRRDKEQIVLERVRNTGGSGYRETRLRSDGTHSSIGYTWDVWFQKSPKIWRDEKNIEIFTKEVNEAEAANSEARRHRNVAWRVLSQAMEPLRAKYIEEQKAIHFGEGGDEESFSDHLRKHRYEEPSTGDLKARLVWLAKFGINPEGMTFAQIVEETDKREYLDREGAEPIDPAVLELTAAALKEDPDDE